MVGRQVKDAGILHISSAQHYACSSCDLDVLHSRAITPTLSGRLAIELELAFAFGRVCIHFEDQQLRVPAMGHVISDRIRTCFGRICELSIVLNWVNRLHFLEFVPVSEGIWCC